MFVCLFVCLFVCIHIFIISPFRSAPCHNRWYSISQFLRSGAERFWQWWKHHLIIAISLAIHILTKSLCLPPSLPHSLTHSLTHSLAISVLFFQIMIQFFPLVSLPHSVSFRSVIPDLIYRGLCVCSIPFCFISLHSAPFRSVLLNNDAIFSLCLPPSLRSVPLFLI